MRDKPQEDQDQDEPVAEVEIVIYPGGQVVMPKLPELAEIAMALGDEAAADACHASAGMDIVVGSRKCG